jgi:uncharacterized protein
MTMKCPRCQKATKIVGNPYRPFCSERCKLIDLGNWISGTYRIPQGSADGEEEVPNPPGKNSEKE